MSPEIGEPPAVSSGAGTSLAAPWLFPITRRPTLPGSVPPDERWGVSRLRSPPHPAVSLTVAPDKFHVSPPLLRRFLSRKSSTRLVGRQGPAGSVSGPSHTPAGSCLPGFSPRYPTGEEVDQILRWISRARQVRSPFLQPPTQRPLPRLMMQPSGWHLGRTSPQHLVGVQHAGRPLSS